jgi:hypothetical protein
MFKRLAKDASLYSMSGVLARGFSLITVPIFKEASLSGEQYYFQYDGHWTAQGHRLAALTIRDYIESQDLQVAED